MGPHAIERIAEDEKIAHIGVIERLDAEMVSGAEESFPARVPDGKRKIAAQVLDARLAPRRERVKDQLRIRRAISDFLALLLKLCLEFAPAIDARVGRDPELPVEARRLAIAEGFVRGSQQRMTESDGPICPHFAAIRPAIGEKLGERLQQRAIRWSSVLSKNSDDAAHRVCVSIEMTELSNGTK
jgi:hypothetical protein